MYPFLDRPNIDESDLEIKGMILVCHQPTLVLFFIGYNYFCMSVYFYFRLGLISEPLPMPLYVPTPVGDF